MRSKFIVALGLAAVLLVAAYGASLYAYFATDAAYRRLVSLQPATRVPVEEILKGFRGSQVIDEKKMNVQIKKSMTGTMSYFRYSKFFDDGIDVVYDSGGQTVTIWPNYE